VAKFGARKQGNPERNNLFTRDLVAFLNRIKEATHDECRDHHAARRPYCRDPILVVPRLLNYIVAIYLIIIGLAGLLPYLGRGNF
jgi:hypothetical protein